jgi:hypothetical protein
VNEYKILKKILDLQFQFPDGFPQTPKDLVSKLLVNKPTERLGSFETGGIKALKLHPFFLVGLFFVFFYYVIFRMLIGIPCLLENHPN